MNIDWTEFFAFIGGVILLAFLFFAAYCAVVAGDLLMNGGGQ